MSISATLWQQNVEESINGANLTDITFVIQQNQHDAYECKECKQMENKEEDDDLSDSKSISNADITINCVHCQEYEYEVHRVHFITHSKVLKAMIYENVKHSDTDTKIILKDITPQAFEIMRDYVYGLNIDKKLTFDCVFDVLLAADKYVIDTLTTKCIEHIREKLIHDKQSLFDFLIAASNCDQSLNGKNSTFMVYIQKILNDNKILQRYACEFYRPNTYPACKPDISKLTVSIMVELLKCDSLYMAENNIWEMCKVFCVSKKYYNSCFCCHKLFMQNNLTTCTTCQFNVCQECKNKVENSINGARELCFVCTNDACNGDGHVDNESKHEHELQEFELRHYGEWRQHCKLCEDDLLYKYKACYTCKSAVCEQCCIKIDTIETCLNNEHKLCQLSDIDDYTTHPAVNKDYKKCMENCILSDRKDVAQEQTELELFHFVMSNFMPHIGFNIIGSRYFMEQIEPWLESLISNSEIAKIRWCKFDYNYINNFKKSERFDFSTNYLTNIDDIKQNDLIDVLDLRENENFGHQWRQFYFDHVQKYDNGETELFIRSGLNGQQIERYGLLSKVLIAKPSSMHESSNNCIAQLEVSQIVEFKPPTKCGDNDPWIIGRVASNPNYGGYAIVEYNIRNPYQAFASDGLSFATISLNDRRQIKHHPQNLV